MLPRKTGGTTHLAHTLRPLLMVLLLIVRSLAEEESILSSGAVYDPSGRFYSPFTPASVHDFLFERDRWLFHYTDVGTADGYKSEMILDLGTSMGFKVVYFAAWDWGWDNDSKRMGLMHVYHGDDSSYLYGTNTQATGDMYATGWHKATSNTVGRYISIRREGRPVAQDDL